MNGIGGRNGLRGATAEAKGGTVRSSKRVKWKRKKTKKGSPGSPKKGETPGKVLLLIRRSPSRVTNVEDELAEEWHDGRVHAHTSTRPARGGLEEGERGIPIFAKTPAFSVLPAQREALSIIQQYGNEKGEKGQEEVGKRRVSSFESLSS